MKKLICILISITLLFSTTMTVEAKHRHDNHNNNNNQNTQDKMNQEFNIFDSSFVKYGRYIVPVEPITEGMGAKYSYKKSTGTLKITKGSDTLVIDFKHKTVKVNGVTDKYSGIFKAKTNRVMMVMLYYIADFLGVDLDYDGHETVIINPGFNQPGFDQPGNITITPIGPVVVANTLNTTTQYLNVSARISAGQATGGRAELYVGSKLVAIDNQISSWDTTVDFTTSDGTPNNQELQAAVPNGGIVTIKLYNSSGYVTVSTVSNPTLKVDYVAPTISGVNSASYDAARGLITVNVSGAGAVGDAVDVTKLILTDSALGRSYQLTNNPSTGSKGNVSGLYDLKINLGSADRAGLAGFGGSNVYLTVNAGSLLIDSAGNSSYGLTSSQMVGVTVTSQGNNCNTLCAPKNITIITYGSAGIPNTLNSNTIYMEVSAKIEKNQATGGRAELYVGPKLVAVDNTISSTDTYVYFSTSDGSPTNAELQTAVPFGGIVTVKLYNSFGNSVVSTEANPTLIVNYSSSVITGITSAVYDAANWQLIITVSGVGNTGYTVDVTKLTLIDSALGRSYQLTNSPSTGSWGTMTGSNTIVIYLGSTDKNGLSGFGSSTVYMTVAAGPFLRDNSGNLVAGFPNSQVVPVTTTNQTQVLDAPRDIKITAGGTVKVENALNTTSNILDVTATITAGQAAGGKAELYVGANLIDVDNVISPTDKMVTFSTDDGTPNNAELRALVPSGGVVTIKLYNAGGKSVTSTSNPTLNVDYTAPTLANISSAIYDKKTNQIYLFVNGAGAVGDTIDVSKIVLFDAALGKGTQLSNAAGTGSTGKVDSSSLITITLGTNDKANLSGYGTSTVLMTIYAGSLIRDAAGNTSPEQRANSGIPVTVTN